MSLIQLLLFALSSDKKLEAKAFRKTQARMRRQQEIREQQFAHYRVGGFR